MTYEELSKLTGEPVREVNFYLPASNIPLLRQLPGFEDLDKPKLTGLRYGLMEIAHKQVCNSKIKSPLQHVLPKHTFCVTRYEGELWFERVYQCMIFCQKAMYNLKLTF